jgi:hypothetical protein
MPIKASRQPSVPCNFFKAKLATGMLAEPTCCCFVRTCAAVLLLRATMQKDAAISRAATQNRTE